MNALKWGRADMFLNRKASRAMNGYCLWKKQRGANNGELYHDFQERVGVLALLHGTYILFDFVGAPSIVDIPIK